MPVAGRARSKKWEEQETLFGDRYGLGRIPRVRQKDLNSCIWSVGLRFPTLALGKAREKHSKIPPLPFAFYLLLTFVTLFLETRLAPTLWNVFRCHNTVLILFWRALSGLANCIESGKREIVKYSIVPYQ